MYLLFEIGGTNMRIGVSADRETLKETKIVPTPKEFEQGIQTIKQIADELSNGEKLTGIAGGIAVIFDKTKSIILHSPNIPGWIDKPLKSELERIFGCPLILENDTVVSGIGESTKGAGTGKKVVAFITLGTGVGGKRIVEGKISVDSSNFEPGHQIIVPNGDPCNCGGRGHMEPYVSGSYFEKKYGQKGEEIKDPKIWDEISKYLAISLVNIVVFWNPDIIVLGGAVAKSIPLDTVNSYLKEFLTIYPTPPELALATLGEKSGLIGALELIKLIEAPVG